MAEQLTQVITDHYAIYNDDCMNIVTKLPDESVDIAIYSPPFADLYNYSSSDNDMSNCRTYEEFMEHYEFLVKEMARVTKPGRMNIVHCFDVPKGITLIDFPGDIIRLHQKHGFYFHDRHFVWKEPLHVAIKTRSRGLMHKTIVKDSTLCRSALPDTILVLRRAGTNKVPVAHPEGLKTYAGENPIPAGLVEKYRNWKNQKTNKLSHWIWQQYASSHWMDIRLNRVLKYKEARDAEDEKHVCPLMLDIIERALVLWSNPGETMFTPFLGVGSEVYTAVGLGRKGIGAELKPAYFRQAVKNIATAISDRIALESGATLFDTEATISKQEENELEELDDNSLTD